MSGCLDHGYRLLTEKHQAKTGRRKSSASKMNQSQSEVEEEASQSTNQKMKLTKKQRRRSSHYARRSSKIEPELANPSKVTADPDNTTHTTQEGSSLDIPHPV